jgi:tetratricopeptide (TPR) repeat protein
MVEIEFHISRSHGLVGLHFTNNGGNFTVSKMTEPCLAAYLGLVEVGDELLSIDGKEINNEADLVTPPDSQGASFSKDDMCLKLNRSGKSYNDIEGEDIKSARALSKSTSKTDHTTQAKLRLTIGEVLLARGDYIAAQDALEDGLNIAYGVNVGINSIVVTAFSFLSQVYYCQGDYKAAKEALTEAQSVINKLGPSQEKLVQELEIVNKKVEVAICLEEEEEMLQSKTRAEEILKIILSLQVYKIIFSSHYIRLH